MNCVCRSFARQICENFGMEAPKGKRVRLTGLNMLKLKQPEGFSRTCSEVLVFGWGAAAEQVLKELPGTRLAELESMHMKLGVQTIQPMTWSDLGLASRLVVRKITDVK